MLTKDQILAIYEANGPPHNKGLQAVYDAGRAVSHENANRRFQAACAAMEGMLASTRQLLPSPDELANDAADYADALLAALAKAPDNA